MDKINNDKVNKYRVSWLQASDAQRRMICQRLGLTYTNVNDEQLLSEIADLQSQQYLATKQTRQAELKKMKKMGQMGKTP